MNNKKPAISRLEVEKHLCEGTSLPQSKSEHVNDYLSWAEAASESFLKKFPTFKHLAHTRRPLFGVRWKLPQRIGLFWGPAGALMAAAMILLVLRPFTEPAYRIKGGAELICYLNGARVDSHQPIQCSAGDTLQFGVLGKEELRYCLMYVDDNDSAITGSYLPDTLRDNNVTIGAATVQLLPYSIILDTTWHTERIFGILSRGQIGPEKTRELILSYRAAGTSTTNDKNIKITQWVLHRK